MSRSYHPDRTKEQMNLSSDVAPNAMLEAKAAQHLKAALENQARELTHLLWRLERARRVLIPGPVGYWRGLTKLAFDSALGGLSATMDDGIAAMRTAIDSTRTAIAGMDDHG